MFHLLWGKMLQWLARACCLFELSAQVLTSVLKSGVTFFSECIRGIWGLSNTGGSRVTKYTSHAQTIACAVLYTPNEKQEHRLKNGSSASQHFSGQWSLYPANTPAQITHFFALHRVRQLKRMVSTIATFVWWPQTCLQLVPRPPPPLSDGHCCTCFSTQKYRVSQKLTYRSVASSFQDSFFLKDFAMRNSNPWILQWGTALMIVHLAEIQEKHFPNSYSGRGIAIIKRLELEGPVCYSLHFEGFT